MNVIFLCHGSILDVYYELFVRLKKSKRIGVAGFYISDRRYFDKFCSQHPEFATNRHFIGEWQITDKVNINPDLSDLKKFENKYFDQYLIWNALVADRRIYQGPLCKVSHDHRPSFSFEEMQSILQHGCKLIESFFDKIRPHVVVGYSSATFGDHICYAFAKARNVNFYNLRHTKINNYMTFTEGLNEDFLHIKKVFISLNDGSTIPERNPWIASKEYIQKACEKKVVYSGHRQFDLSWKTKAINIPELFIKALYADIKFLCSKKDNQSKNWSTKLFWYDRIVRLLRIMIQELSLGSSYGTIKDLEKGKNIFFPLHAEPEVSLSVLAKQYQNQIEVVRNIARQLPIEYRLVVKDHPRNFGQRSKRYIKKLMEIPNVIVVDPSIDSNDVISRCDLTVIISGYVGFETILYRKPVVTLGKTLLNILPPPIVTHVENIDDLWTTIRKSLNYVFDEEILCRYVYSVMEKSVPIDLMTVLLRKQNRKGRLYSKEAFDENIGLLCHNLLSLIENDA